MNVQRVEHLRLLDRVNSNELPLSVARSNALEEELNALPITCCCFDDVVVMVTRHRTWHLTAIRELDDESLLALVRHLDEATQLDLLRYFLHFGQREQKSSANF